MKIRFKGILLKLPKKLFYNLEIRMYVLERSVRKLNIEPF